LERIVAAPGEMASQKAISVHYADNIDQKSWPASRQDTDIILQPGTSAAPIFLANCQKEKLRGPTILLFCLYYGQYENGRRADR
jgi:hypothetical protein